MWTRYCKNRLAVIGLFLLLFLIMLALCGPAFSSFSYDQQDLLLANKAPDHQHWFGTDALGRDLFIRICYGARISLMVGVITSIICTVIGVIYGGIAGYCGGLMDEIMMRIVEVLTSIPFLLYIILLTMLLTPGLTTILTALVLVYWLNIARIVRGQVLLIKEQEYILAARAIGAGNTRILFKHILPNAFGPIIVSLTLLIPEAIFSEAFLSFLGLGVATPLASWGVLANEGIQGLRNYPWQLFYPTGFISLTILAFHFIGDGLREVFDPQAYGPLR